jgi:hypothetical protein
MKMELESEMKKISRVQGEKKRKEDEEKKR